MPEGLLELTCFVHWIPGLTLFARDDKSGEDVGYKFFGVVVCGFEVKVGV